MSHDIRAVQLFNLPVLPSLDALTHNLPETTPTSDPIELTAPPVDIAHAPQVPRATRAQAAATDAPPDPVPTTAAVLSRCCGSATAERGTTQKHEHSNERRADGGSACDHHTSSDHQTSASNSGTSRGSRGSGGSSQMNVLAMPTFPRAPTQTAAAAANPTPQRSPPIAPTATAPAAMMRPPPAVPFFVAAFPDPCMGYIPACLQPRTQRDREAARQELQSRRERFRTKKALQRQRRAKAVRYTGRKVYADSRPRVNGRFIRKEGPTEPEEA